MEKPQPIPPRPRVLRVDLAQLESASEAGGFRARGGSLEPWRHARPELDRVGSWSGAALGLALISDAVAAGSTEPAPLVFSVGDCVRRGVPTAVRASVASIGPMSGAYAEGQVGGELGSRLAGLADALVLERATRRSKDRPGGVLEIGWDAQVAEPRVVLHGGALADGLRELSPAETWRVLRDRFGDCVCVRVGAAAERDVPFASLAVGGEAPSYVGRGGLGQVFARLGLKALVVTARPVPVEPEEASRPGARGLFKSLSRSPRLAARSSSGTFELWHAFSARGDLHARNHTRSLAPEEGARLTTEAAGAAREQHGCRGCPTPCGWVFETSSGARQHGTFSATYALGPNVGLERFEDALGLLRTCDELGVDAVETGAALALLCEHGAEENSAEGGLRYGDREGLTAAVEAIGTEDPRGRRLALGAARLARELGLERAGHSSAGQSSRPEGDLAAVLAQCVSAAGADPMRTFPFLTDGSAASLRALRALLQVEAPPAVPEASSGAGLGDADAWNRWLDPAQPRGKGRLVWAYENWKAAVDTTGFCAFSAAGLLADGLLGLSELSEAIEPTALQAARKSVPWNAIDAGRALLAAGASVVLLRHAVNAELGVDPEVQRPTWARAEVDRPGMLDEYRRQRGLGADGRPVAGALARLGTPAAGAPAEELPGAEASMVSARDPELPSSVRTEGGGAALPGSVTLRAVGPLADELGSAQRVELDLPAPLVEVLRAACHSNPRAGRYLLRDDRPVPAVYRAGRRVDQDDPVRAGDVLDLVVAIRGG